MIPSVDDPNTPPCGIPRESGDDPIHLDLRVDEEKYSPRERG